MGKGASVLLADDNVLIRDLIGAILDGTEEFAIVASAFDARGAEAAAAEHEPDLALVDVRMPGGGPAAARAVRTASPGTAVIALSSADDAASVRLMLAAGAVSYVVKGTPADELLATMRSALTPPAPPPVLGPPQRVLIALTDAIELDRLADAVMDTNGLELIGLAQTAYHAISLAARLRPEVAVIDPAMATGGARLAAALAAASPTTRIVASLEDVVGPLTASAAERDQRRFERLAAVLAAGRIGMHLQPIMGLADANARGFEALARFPGHPNPGPDVWFAEAHRAELGTELERLAVRSGLAELDRLPSGSFLSVNVSPDTAVSPGLREDLASIGDASRVVVELTEHAPVHDYAVLGRALDELRDLGARVAVDDCGAGFTSLRHVALIAPDFLKLDMVLCRDVREPARAALARALVGFAAETGSTVIAEGIEEPDDLAALRELGIELGQGFLLSRPEPADVLLSA